MTAAGIKNENSAHLDRFVGILAEKRAKAMIVRINEQYMATATEFGADMLFLLEEFCGHGFENDNPAAPCYRGPNTPRWFDLTCIHPNPAGHDHIRDMFMAVVNE